MGLLLVLLMINIYGFIKYINYSIQETTFRKQIITDFFCPIGSFFGRLVFKFNIKENPSGYILGFFFYMFIIIMFYAIF